MSSCNAACTSALARTDGVAAVHVTSASYLRTHAPPKHLTTDVPSLHDHAASSATVSAHAGQYLTGPRLHLSLLTLIEPRRTCICLACPHLLRLLIFVCQQNPAFSLVVYALACCSRHNLLIGLAAAPARLQPYGLALGQPTAPEALPQPQLDVEKQSSIDVEHRRTAYYLL
jgi:hypothetical protein